MDIEQIKQLIELVAWLLVAFFVLMTGTHLLPQIANNNSDFSTIVYAISILITATLFLLKGIPFNFSETVNGHRKRS